MRRNGEVFWNRIIFAATASAIISVVTLPPAPAMAGPFSVSYRIAALEGDPAPNSPGFTYDRFQAPHIDQSGNVIFEAAITDGNSLNSDQIFYELGGTPTIVFRTGDPAAGFPAGFAYDRSTEKKIDAPDRYIFTGSVTGPDITDFSNDTAAWVQIGATRTRIMREGDPVPGLPGVDFGSAREPNINQSGQWVFKSRMTGSVTPTNDTALFADTGSGITLIAREGDPVPGLPGVTISILRFSDIAGNGDVIFSATLAGTGVSFANRDVLLRRSGAGTSIIARKGDPVPGQPAGTVYDSFAKPVVNENGEILFQVNLAGPGITAGVNDSFLLSINGGTVTVISQGGDAAPGLPGVTQEVLDGLALNNLGFASFLGRLSGTGIGIGNREALFAEDPFGDLTLIGQDGETVIEVADGDFRTIANIAISDEAFNDQNEIAFEASFLSTSNGPGGSAIIVASFVAETEIPEPGMLALFGMGLAGLGLMRRRTARRGCASS